MCDDDGGPSASAWYEEWRRSRKSHRCEACDETIRKGDRYHFASGICDGYPFSIKHCTRCWTIYEALRKAKPREQIALELNCGTPWKNAPPEIAALAFALPADFSAAPQEAR